MWKAAGCLYGQGSDTLAFVWDEYQWEHRMKFHKTSAFNCEHMVLTQQDRYLGVLPIFEVGKGSDGLDQQFSTVSAMQPIPPSTAPVSNEAARALPAVNFSFFPPFHVNALEVIYEPVGIPGFENHHITPEAASTSVYTSPRIPFSHSKARFCVPYWCFT